MKLSKESINNILNLQKNKLPLVYYYGNLYEIENLKTIVKKIGGELSAIEDNCTYRDNNSLLIILKDLNEDNIEFVEKQLIKLTRKVAVLLDAKGIDSVIYKKNLVLSFLNRYNINIIKVTKEEIDNLINLEYEDNSSIKDTEKYIKYRYFSRKNNAILILEDEGYYITEGYSEFYIKNINNFFFYKEEIENIYDILIAVIISVCNEKCEIIEGILIATLIFVVAQELVLKKNDKIEKIDEVKEKLLYYSLVKEIYDMDIEKINLYGYIDYKFIKVK